ncbi:hypothetical protein [Virgibacillus sp. YIM 98842]|jgi:hypothetical protein|uniref:hypothetical protein n=1 Tax=Virgibacillus sp. YIM 98842 TaxID=2663533 RepID=UPI0013D97231|nr:hypothetical protein [Virgibacillus sp. YIM 98842]
MANVTPPLTHAVVGILFITLPMPENIMVFQSFGQHPSHRMGRYNDTIIKRFLKALARSFI